MKIQLLSQGYVALTVLAAVVLVRLRRLAPTARARIGPRSDRRQTAGTAAPYK